MVKSRRRVPMRRCLGCREQKAKNELVRVVRRPSGEVALDATGKMAGRGAYVCPAKSCLELAQKGKQLERSLGVSIPAEVFDGIVDATVNAPRS